jgi:hypothetical protein
MISIVCLVPKNYETEKWPKTFVEKPDVGDLIESESGKILQVDRFVYGSTGASSPYLKMVLVVPR